MNLLLDTHTLVWALENNPILSEPARKAILDNHNLVYVSAVSAWEMSIKQALGKLKIPSNLAQEMEQHRFTELKITIEHSQRAGSLPHLHQDPFDRMLVAQAQIEGLVLVTRDKFIPKYSVKVLMA